MPRATVTIVLDDPNGYTVEEDEIEITVRREKDHDLDDYVQAAVDLALARTRAAQHAAAELGTRTAADPGG